MKRTTQRLLIALAAAGVLGTTAVAWAANDRGACHGPADGPRAEHMQQRMQERMQGRMAQHQTQLKTALKLTPAQETAWQTYTQAMQATPTPHQRMDHSGWDQLTTPQRLEKMQAFHAASQARMGQRMTALQQFYAALTPEQQKVFDTQQPHFHGPDGAGEHGGQHGRSHGQRHG